MPMLKIKGIEKAQIIKESTTLIDELQDLIECPRDYFTIEIINNEYIMDGNLADAPALIEVAWFDRGQEIQDRAAKIITQHFKKDECSLDVIFHSLKNNCYYENGEHF